MILFFILLHFLLPLLFNLLFSPFQHLADHFAERKVMQFACTLLELEPIVLANCFAVLEFH
jgi:hypothetical protein